jgi:uncharacterized integral membrane protein
MTDPVSTSAPQPPPGLSDEASVSDQRPPITDQRPLTTDQRPPTRAGRPVEERRPTRVSAAWVAVAVGLVLLLLLLVFILQNQQRAGVHFLWLDGSVPLGVALFAASILGGGLVAIAGASRIVQLRRSARRGRSRRTSA